MDNVKIELYKELNSKVLEEIFQLEKKVFPSPLPKEKIQRELSTKQHMSVFIAYDQEAPIAYKVGFERSQKSYYSWIGGVDPDYRGTGLATKLMYDQHQFASGLGYQIVSTQTDNSFKPMIILNLKSGFEIKGTMTSTGDDHITIIMEKNLKP